MICSSQKHLPVDFQLVFHSLIIYFSGREDFFFSMIGEGREVYIR